MDLIAKPTWQPIALLHKRIGDERAYQIDCQELLRQHELLVKVLSTSADGLAITSARTRAGRALEIVFGSATVPTTQPYKDFTVTATMQTTQGVLQVVFGVRVRRI